ncbi:phosphoglucosamine mutase [Candidatus Dependentiae bacterium]|nr:phosphoglucosamine mutase [Candidatus Dependentiae bacterium]
MNNLFGTDGIRGPVGTYPFTPEGVKVLGKALGAWSQEKYGSHASILIGHDTRESCTWIKDALTAGLLHYPITIYDAGVLPTPAISYLVSSNSSFNCGIVISASHNVYSDNGLKIHDTLTGKLTADDELRISELIRSFSSAYLQDTTYGVLKKYPDAYSLYLNALLTNFKSMILTGKKIVLDVANGATYKLAPAVFEALGATVITLNNKPTGININENCGALHLEGLQKAVIDTHATIGFAFDGDGDRIMAVSGNGIVKDGDDILALLSNHPAYAHLDTLVGTVMTNQALEVFLHKRDKKLIRTAVGDKYIAQALTAHSLFLGGEPSGHIILRDKNKTGDGILVALRIIEALEHTDNWDMVTFLKYPQITLNIKVKRKKSLEEEPLLSLIEESKKQLRAGRLLVRYSGTEPLLRVMVEEQNAELALSIASTLAANLERQLL